MTIGPRDGDEIVIERLHYGKLAVGEELRIPPSEGFGVTRRSRGLDPSFDSDFAPARLLGLRRFDAGAVDDTNPHGCLAVRSAPARFAPLAPLVLMRTRFRPEDGERGQGRRYQQSAIWAADFESWRRNPRGVLALADAELRARPDLLSEEASRRFQSEALRRRLDRAPAGAVRPATTAYVVDLLCSYAYRGEDCLVTFGEGCDFTSEAEFLASVGYALSLLPQDYPRWRDISLLSGLRCALPGICLRYLPSYRAAQRAA